MPALLLSPQFWISVIGLLGSLLTLFWWFVGRKEARDKAQAEETKRAEDLESQKQKEALEERQKIDDSIQKQNDSRDHAFEESK